MTEEASNEFRVRCGACGLVWVAIYLPMPIDKFAAVAGSLHCPGCAQDARKLFWFVEDSDA